MQNKTNREASREAHKRAAWKGAKRAQDCVSAVSFFPLLFFVCRHSTNFSRKKSALERGEEGGSGRAKKKCPMQSRCSLYSRPVINLLTSRFPFARSCCWTRDEIDDLDFGCLVWCDENECVREGTRGKLAWNGMVNERQQCAAILFFGGYESEIKWNFWCRWRVGTRGRDEGRLGLAFKMMDQWWAWLVNVKNWLTMQGHQWPSQNITQ
jgi:hypothetical protein